MQVPGIKVNLKSVDGCTPIMRALRRCKLDCVQAMMRVSGLMDMPFLETFFVLFHIWCCMLPNGVLFQGDGVDMETTDGDGDSLREVARVMNRDGNYDDIIALLDSKPLPSSRKNLKSASEQLVEQLKQLTKEQEERLRTIEEENQARQEKLARENAERLRNVANETETEKVVIVAKHQEKELIQLRKHQREKVKKAIEENRERTERQVKELREKLAKENEEKLRLLMLTNKEEKESLVAKHKEQMKLLTEEKLSTLMEPASAVQCGQFT